MKNERKKMYISVIALVVAIIGLTVAYAALSTSLNVSFGDVTQSTLTWNVGFEGSTAPGTGSGTGTVGRSCGDATITPSSVSIGTTTVSKPQDKCVYALNVKNSGTINADLSSITPKTPNDTTCTSEGANMICGNVTYQLTTDATGTNILTNNKALAAGASLPIYLVVSYTGEELNEESVAQTGAGFTLNYVQS